MEQVDVKSFESFVVWLVGSQWGWMALLADMDVDDLEELGVELEMQVGLIFCLSVGCTDEYKTIHRWCRVHMPSVGLAPTR